MFCVDLFQWQKHHQRPSLPLKLMLPVRCLCWCNCTPPLTTVLPWTPAPSCSVASGFMRRLVITHPCLACMSFFNTAVIWAYDALHINAVSLSLNFKYWFLWFLQISGHTFGNIALTIKVASCVLRSKGSCSVEKELPFIPEACSSNACPNSTRISFFLEQLQEPTPTRWDLECSIRLCHSDVWIHQRFLLNAWLTLEMIDLWKWLWLSLLLISWLVPH